MKLSLLVLACLLLAAPAASSLALAQDSATSSGATYQSIDRLWDQVEPPPAPELHEVLVDSKDTALLVLDLEELTCNMEHRPRCVQGLDNTATLILKARASGMPVVYSLTPKETPFLPEVEPLRDDPVVASSVDKFWNTDLDEILQDLGVEQVIVTGTAAHGAVLHTATAAGFRGFRVIVPVDCLSAADLYTEQASVQLLLTGPATRKAVTLTRGDMIELP